MALDLTSIPYKVFEALTTYVFGSYEYTSMFLIVCLLVFSMLLQMPLPISLAIPIPLLIVLAAYGFLNPGVAALIVGAFFVLSVTAFLTGLGINN